jgi:hypothetical protein
MKRIFAPGFLLLLLQNIASAQLTITTGAQLSLSGNLQLTLFNTDLVNNGALSAGTGVISFTGSTPSSIGGSQTSRFYTLEVNKAGASRLLLQQPINIDHQVTFTSGLLDLNSYDANLGSTGSLNGEQQSSHITASNGGMVLFSSPLNSPASANPGNLGLLITSTQDLGNTIIRRGNQSQTTPSATGNSILRYYDILPANNTNLNATLRFQYMDDELNGLDENTLTLWEQPAAQNWTHLGADSRNATANYVEKNNIPALGRVTLSSPPNALPIRFILFNAQCNGNSVILTWKTAMEQNSHFYTIERSIDAVQWAAVGNVPAAGNAVVENSYFFIDNNPVDNAFYRIAEHDLDGSAHYTTTIRADCDSQEPFKVWPNPVKDMLYINGTVTVTTGATIKLFDSKGALVRQQSATLQRGNNLLIMDVMGIAPGLYVAVITYSNGKPQIQKLMKE